MTHVRTFDVAAMKAKQGLAPDASSEGQAKGEHSSRSIYGTETSRTTDQTAFKPMVTSATKALYANAQAGTLLPQDFSSKEEAKNGAAMSLASLRGYAEIINRMGDGDLELGGTFNSAASEEDKAASEIVRALDAHMRDILESRRMLLVVEADVFAKTFNIDEPIYEVEDGKVQINAFDIEYGGDTIMRSLGDGKAAEYRADGTLKVDTYA